MAKNRGVYVETLITGDIEVLWERTQDPHLHNQWDARFTEIKYLPQVDIAEPQRLLYATRMAFGIGFEGAGEVVATRNGPDGSHTSAFKFWSDHPLSLIREGSGYWKYIPTDTGTRFVAWYDYRVRFGAFGRLIDRLLFRRMMAWATAWSMDRLRLWVDYGVAPRHLLHNWFAPAPRPSADNCIRQKPANP